MDNNFEISDNKMSVSISFDSDLNDIDKKKINQLIVKSIELWYDKEKFVKKLQESLDKNSIQ